MLATRGCHHLANDILSLGMTGSEVGGLSAGHGNAQAPAKKGGWTSARSTKVLAASCQERLVSAWKQTAASVAHRPECTKGVDQHKPASSEVHLLDSKPTMRLPGSAWLLAPGLFFGLHVHGEISAVLVFVPGYGQSDWTALRGSVINSVSRDRPTPAVIPEAARRYV